MLMLRLLEAVELLVLLVLQLQLPLPRVQKTNAPWNGGADEFGTLTRGMGSERWGKNRTKN
jgi:hypothetical protein